MEKVNNNMYHIFSIKSENQEVFFKSTARKCTRKCAAIRPIVVFHSSGQGRDGTIASRLINRENNIEALVILKKIQFALGSPNRYEFYSGAKKKMSGSGKSEQEHVPHFLHKK